MIVSLSIFGTARSLGGRTELTTAGIGNAFCAAAPSMETLIAARALAGVGGGGLQTRMLLLTDLWRS